MSDENESLSVPEMRERIYETLQNIFTQEDRMLVNWCMMAESVDGAGRRWLSRIDGSPDGAGLPSWTRAGLLNAGMEDGGWEAENVVGEDEDDFDFDA